MRVDTFARLILLDTLVRADVGHLLGQDPLSTDQFRDALTSRIGDLVDEIDTLDAVAAARAYDSIVDLFAALPEEREGIVEAAVAFHASMARTIDRGMDPDELRQGSTWAVVLDELLGALARDYERARAGDDGEPSREQVRATVLAAAVRDAAERVAVDIAREAGAELRADTLRLTLAVQHTRAEPAVVEALVRIVQRHASRQRPSPLRRIGAFVLGQVLTRERRRRQGEPPGGIERRRAPGTGDRRASKEKK